MRQYFKSYWRLRDKKEESRKYNGPPLHSWFKGSTRLREQSLYVKLRQYEIVHEQLFDAIGTRTYVRDMNTGEKVEI